MIGIVLVSHSARLAEGVAELVRGLGGPEVRLAAAGGLEAEGPVLGTDPLRVREAIDRVYSHDGVLVLVDLGSALLSAEMAVELLPPERQAHVLVCDAPLVEGAVAAAVHARLGGPLERVAAEARAALTPKQGQLRAGPPLAPPPDAPAAALPGAPAGQVLRLTLRNRLGLHARPAVRLVQAVARAGEVEVRIENLTARKGPARARSLTGLLTLGARCGDELLVTATGPAAAQALEAIRALAAAGFGDADGPDPAPGVAPQAPAASGGEAGALRGIPISPGVAVGPARPLRRREPSQAGAAPGAADPGAERARLDAALRGAAAELRSTRDAVAAHAGPGAGDITEAYLAWLEDEALLRPSRQAIAEERLAASAAWARAFGRIAAAHAALEDPYLRERAADVEDVGWLVLAHLGAGATLEPPAEPGIAVADDLTAADAARLDPERVLAIVTARGGATAHGAILARALGIPAVAGVGTSILTVPAATQLLVDATAGLVWTAPSAAALEAGRARAEASRAERAAARAAGAGPAITRDGRRVEVVANVGSAAEARAAVACGAEGVGVLRTEFLFQGRQAAPDEEEQLAAYRDVAAALGGRPLVVRTLDAGGDKPLPYLDLGREKNPFLGWRAIRPCLADPGFFKVQLRAILRLAAEAPVRILFPMIATLGEWRAARALLDEARREVLAAGRAAPARLEAGIMVEIPSVTVQAGAFAREVDFLSIGTNDLLQYTFAAERGDARLAALSDPLQPALLELIRRTVEAGHAAGKPVAVCGEMAADLEAVPLLVGLGVDELSTSPPAIPGVKERVRALDAGEVRGLALAAVEADSPAAVRALLAGALQPGTPAIAARRPPT